MHQQICCSISFIIRNYNNLLRLKFIGFRSTKTSSCSSQLFHEKIESIYSINSRDYSRENNATEMKLLTINTDYNLFESKYNAVAWNISS